ncbi:diacylglycerol/lipid kinase family protein [Vulgatibacter incomptus]|uniref:Transcription regulator n=1 Tax=Vulgatibacter incomptus TaxID=1391653 RepID=A0A0K1P8P9_9BACT|nr:diacylglycerol kinase family protein [Vulgatibacter incomptus]AKU89908.1 Transcription regulator [Vulgatibacter incomptus]
MDRKVVFIVNPKSGNGATGRQWRSLASGLRAQVGDFGELFTTRPQEATALARHALEGGADVVVAVGGDGTINEVLNGFFADDGTPVRQGAALSVLPRGTGSDFLRSLGFASGDAASIGARLAAGRRRQLDVGLVTYERDDGRLERRYFANVASFGTSGLVDRYVNRATKVLGGKASFTIGAVRGLLAYEDRRCRVRFDDGPWEELDITCLAVANGRFFGGGMMVAPDAKMDDGLFDVTIWSGFGLSDFVFQRGRIYDGRHVELKGTRTLRAKRIEATCAEECLLDIDGEAPGRLPSTFEILPGALDLIA